MGRMKVCGAAWLAAGLAAVGSANAQTIYPIHRAYILSGSRFDFKVELPGAPAAQALIICERIRRALEVQDWTSFSPDLRVTISVGLSEDPRASNHEKLLDAADARLYEAKRTGRNRTCL